MMVCCKVSFHPTDPGEAVTLKLEWNFGNVLDIAA